MNTASTSPRLAHRQPDRRGQARVVARGVVSHLQTMDASMPGLAVENLSPGGLFVRCAAALEPGTRVMIQLVRPGLKRAIPAQGCVVSVIAPAAAREMGTVAGMGIRLDPLDADAGPRLRELVASLAASAPPPVPVAETADESSLVQDLEDEIQTLRRELLRRNRTIGELATRLAALETPRRPGALCRPDPRAF
jgi:PilZ domain